MVYNQSLKGVHYEWRNNSLSVSITMINFLEPQRMSGVTHNDKFPGMPKNVKALETASELFSV